MKKLHMVTAGMLMLSSSLVAYSPWADMQKHFDDMEKRFAEMHEEMDKVAATVGDAKGLGASGYALQAETQEGSDGKAMYVVTASVPGFTQDDIKITVKVDSQEGSKHLKKSLEISSAKKAEPMLKKSKKGKDKEGEVVQYSSTIMQSSSWSNGLGKSVKFENGVLDMKIDLPSNIDEENYTMNFDDEKNTLTIEFAQEIKAPVKTKELKFNNVSENEK